MAWKLELSPAAERDLDKLDQQRARRILAFRHGRLAVGDNPHLIGEARTGQRFGEFWKHRVGDYRAVYRIVARIEDQLVRVLVVRIAHRREVYR